MSKSKKTGVTLIEVMIAIVILVVLVLGSAAVVYQAEGGIQRQQNKREATVAANQLMEVFWNKSYADLRDNYGGTSVSRTETVNGNAMSATISIGAEQPDVNGTLYIEISVDVDHRGAANDIVFVTRRYLYGINKAAL